LPFTFVVGAPAWRINFFIYRDFEFGVQVDHSKHRPMDDKLSLQWAWSRHVTYVKFSPLKYLWNGLS